MSEPESIDTPQDRGETDFQRITWRVAKRLKHGAGVRATLSPLDWQRIFDERTYARDSSLKVEYLDGLRCRMSLAICGHRVDIDTDPGQPERTVAWP